MSGKPPAFNQISATPNRDGAWYHETRLTSTYVQKYGVSELADLQLDDARGMEGQPLCAPDVMGRDGLPHDLIAVADMSCRAYAFDFNTHKLLWKQTLGNPINIAQYDRQYDYWHINPTWGILGTGAINPATNAWYVISFSSIDGSMGKGTYRFHTLSLTDGSDLAPPLVLDNATFSPPDGSKPIVLGAIPRKQRAGLAIDSRDERTTIFAAFSTFAESSLSNTAFVLAIDVTNTDKPSIAAVWVSGWKHPPNGGIWEGGEGLAIDDDGYIYALTGNGGFDGKSDLGECFVKLKYTPASGSTPASLASVAHWSPFSDAGAAGQDPTQPQVAKGTEDHDDMSSTDLIPNNTINDIAAGKPTNVRNPITDEDLGSGGLVLFMKSMSGFSRSAAYGGGKHGIIYGADPENMGDTQNADFAPSKIAGNYAKLVAPPIGATFDGTNIDLMPTDMTMLPVLPNGKTAHIHGSPRIYKSSDHGFMLFCGGENQPVRAFKINPDLSLSYLACTRESASWDCAGSGMPGTFLSISASAPGTNTGVLWGLMPRTDANREISDGRLIAWASNWIDGDGYLIKLWDSWDWGWQFKHCKFGRATIWNGKVIVPTYNGVVKVVG